MYLCKLSKNLFSLKSDTIKQILAWLFSLKEL